MFAPKHGQIRPRQYDLAQHERTRMAGEVRENRNPLNAALPDHAFRKLAENIPTLCWIADEHGYIVWYNPRWYAYTGTTEEQMRGWGWQSVHDPRSLAEVLERWSEAIATARPFEMVFPIRGADGVFRPFLTRITPAFDAQGAVVNWYGVNTDISRQVEAEAAFARSEARFRVLADSMPQMVWSARPDGYNDYHNARWYEFTGAPVGATHGTAWSEMVHPDDRAGVLARWRQALAAGEAHEAEYRLRHRCGQYRWVLTRAQAERDADGNITRWYGTSTDIEEIVQARSVLKRSRDELECEVAARTGERNLLATLVETTDVMIMALDLDHTILAINTACADECELVYGLRPRAGENLLAVLAGQPEQQAAVRATWARALAGEEVTFVEAHGDPARVRRHYEVTFRTLRDAAGERIGAFHFVTDISERVRSQALLAQAQEALLQSQKLEAMGQLTGGVAHDFNNLLTPIIAVLDMLRRRGIGGERERPLIDGAYQSAQRATVLVHRLLAFARRQPLRTVATDIAALMREMAALVASTTGPQVSLELDVPPALPWARADPHQLELAILNLAVNARDAMAGMGTIRIAACDVAVAADEVPGLAAGRYVRITVADTGAGMDEATLARAVEPFFSTKGIGKGTGLGLSMAHGLASQLGGALTIASAPGAGTEVAMWLPEVAAAPVAAPASAARAPIFAPDAAGAALLVDDEDAIRLSTADMLAELGFSVIEAASGEAALRAIEDGLRPDVVVTDHLMPGMTGVELAGAVRARLPGAKVLIVSGFAEAEGIDPSLPRLTKPFVQAELARALAELRGAQM